MSLLWFFFILSYFWRRNFFKWNLWFTMYCQWLSQKIILICVLELLNISINPPLLGYCLLVRSEFLLYDSLHWKLSDSVKVERISVTSVCLSAHFGVFFRKLKILRLKLHLFSRPNWISELANLPISWGRGCGHWLGHLHVSYCFCYSQFWEESFRLGGNFLGNQK